MEATPNTAGGLNRVLSPFGVMLLTLSALSPVGSVYVGGGAVLHMAGTGAAIAYILGGVVAAILALVYAELAAAFPRSGGYYPAVTAILGRWAGFPIITGMLVLGPAFMAFTGLGLADYVRVLAPGLPLGAIAIGGVLAACVIASLRVRTSERVTALFMAIEAIALTLLVGVALMHPARSLVSVVAHPVMLDSGQIKPTSPAVVALALIAGAWSCGGASFACYFGEELKDAQVRIGRVVAWTGVVASLAIAAPVTLTVLSIGQLKPVLAAEAPFAVYLAAAGGPLIATLVSLGVVAALFNNLIAAAMAYARLFYSTARDGVLPQPLAGWMARLDGRRRTPIVAMAVVAGASLLAELAGVRRLTVLMAIDLTMIPIALAALYGRRRAVTGRWFKAWLHPAAPLFTLGFMVVSIWVNWLDLDAGRPSLLIMGGLFLGSIAVYLLHIRRSAVVWHDGGLLAAEPGE
jgi:amino acid transporter